MKLYSVFAFTAMLGTSMAEIYCHMPNGGDPALICSNTSPAWYGCDRFCPQHCGGVTGGCFYKTEVNGDYDCWCRV